MDLGIVHQCGQLPGQSDRLGREIDVARVALVEHEVEHPHHRAHVAGLIDTGLPDRALGAADALGHGGLGHEVGLRDLTGREPTHGSEGQRHRRRRRQIRAGAEEVEPQRVVGARDVAGRRVGVDSPLSVAAGCVGPRHVEEGSPRHRDEPRRGVSRLVALPGGECPDERLLHRVLGRREVGSATDEDAQDLWDELPKFDVVGDHEPKLGGSAMKGRTSSHSWSGSPPAPGAADSSPASSIARS